MIESQIPARFPKENDKEEKKNRALELCPGQLVVLESFPQRKKALDSKYYDNNSKATIFKGGEKSDDHHCRVKEVLKTAIAPLGREIMSDIKMVSFSLQ